MSVEVAVQHAHEEAGTAVTIPADNQLQAWAETAVDAVQPNGNLQMSVRIVDEDEIIALNRDYRGQDRPTNVLSFPFELPPGLPAAAAEGELGDVVVCAAVVAREALEQGKTAESHWAHMIIHGTLHLLGYDHETDREAADMAALEIALMDRLGYADPYRDSVCA